MKKILSSALAVSLIGCSCYQTVICAESSESQIKSAAAGILSVNAADEDVYAANGMFTITYDSEKIRIDSAAAGECLKGILCTINTGIPGKIIIGFASAEPVLLNGAIAEFEYSSLSGNYDDLSAVKNITTDELVTIDKSGKETDLSSYRAALKYLARPVDISLSEDKSENGISVYAGITGNTGFTNGIFTVSYDTSVMKFTGGDAGELLEDAMCEINESEPGTIKIAFLSDKCITADGKAVKLNFDEVKSGKTELSIRADELVFLAEEGTVTGISSITSGCTVDIKSGEQQPEVPVENAGDTNRDGSVTVCDLMLLVKAVLNSEAGSFDSSYDLNDDGVISSADVIILKELLCQ